MEKKTVASRKQGKPRTRVTEGSGNVFRDLGIPQPERELVRAHLTLQIRRLIQKLGLTQSEAARRLGIRQPHVSLLMNNRAGSFSLGRLLDFLTALGQDVEIRVRPTRQEVGELSVRLR